MATEASLADQEAEGHVEEKKVTDDIQNVTEVSQPAEAEVKHEEEKLKLEDSASAEAPVIEAEEKLDSENSETVVEVVKKHKEESKNLDDASEKIEAPKEESDIPCASELAAEIDEKGLKEQVEVSDVSQSPREAEEGLKEQVKVSDVSQSPSVVAEEPAKDLEAPSVKVKCESAKEPEVPEVVTQEVKSEEKPESSTVTYAEITVTETPEANESAEIPQDVKALAGEIEVTPELPKQEPPSKETPNEVKLEYETGKVQEIAASESLDTVSAKSNETKEVGEGAVIHEGVEKCSAEADANGVIVEPVMDESEAGDKQKILKEGAPEASLATETGFAKSIVEPVAKAEEEMSTEVKEPKSSEAAKEDNSTEVSDIEGEKSSEGVEEKKCEILAGEKPSLDETSKDLDVANEVAGTSPEGEKASECAEMTREKDESLECDKPALVETSGDLMVEGEETSTKKLAKEPEEAVETAVDSSQDEKEEVEKAGRSLAETMRNDDGLKTGEDVPKQEVPAKPSLRQSNNIISKVKQSMVKVKKALLGKSPSSKTVSTEGKDDIKVK